MSINLFTLEVRDQVIAALCNTLVYSLLQGVILAAVAGLIIVCTRKISAAIRYNLLISALVLFVIGAAATFAVQLGNIKTVNPIVSANRSAIPDKGHDAPVQPANHLQTFVPVITTVTTSTKIENASTIKKQNYLSLVSNFLNTNHNTIVLIWFLIICIRAMQLAVGLRGVYQLKNTEVFAVPADWIDKLGNFAQALGIKQPVALLESGLAKVPMAIGYLKPVILIPIGLLTALSTQEVEAILMHELAHIRRRDYLINLLQSLVEIVFFFNPAVMWVSALIKAEREYCCDDMVLAQNTSRNEYIRALVSCEEYQASPAYAMAFPGQKNGLVERVKRLVSNRNSGLNTFEKTLITVCLVVAGIGFSAFAERETIKRAAKAVAKAITIQDKPAPIAQPAVTPQILQVAPVDTVKKVVVTDGKKFANVVTARNLSVTKRYGSKDEDTLVTINLDYSYAQRNLDLRKSDKDSTLNQKYQVWLAQLKQQRVPNAGNLSGQDLDTWYDKKIEEAKSHSSPVGDKTYNSVSSSSRSTTFSVLDFKGVNSKYTAFIYLDSMGRQFNDYRLDKDIKYTDNLRHFPRTYKEELAFELALDGLIESSDTALDNVRYSDNGELITVNGKVQSAEISKKYLATFDRHTNTPTQFFAEPIEEAQHILNRIILELGKDRIIAKDDATIANLQFDLNDRAFVVNGAKQPDKVFKKYHDAFVKTSPNGETNWVYGTQDK